MSKLTLIAAALALTIAVGCAQTVASPQPGASNAATPTATSCQALPAALRGCAPVTCTQPHPFMRSFTIEHRISGPDGDRCGYTQSMPGNMTMSCRFTEAGRAEMASLIEDMARGNFSGGTGQQNVMTRECEVRDSSGAIVPWG